MSGVKGLMPDPDLYQGNKNPKEMVSANHMTTQPWTRLVANILNSKTDQSHPSGSVRAVVPPHQDHCAKYYLVRQPHLATRATYYQGTAHNTSGD